MENLLRKRKTSTKKNTIKEIKIKTEYFCNNCNRNVHIRDVLHSGDGINKQGNNGFICLQCWYLNNEKI